MEKRSFTRATDNTESLQVEKVLLQGVLYWAHRGTVYIFSPALLGRDGAVHHRGVLVLVKLSPPSAGSGLFVPAEQRCFLLCCANE